MPKDKLGKSGCGYIALQGKVESVWSLVWGQTSIKKLLRSSSSSSQRKKWHKKHHQSDLLQNSTSTSLPNFPVLPWWQDVLNHTLEVEVDRRLVEEERPGFYAALALQLLITPHTNVCHLPLCTAFNENAKDWQWLPPQRSRGSQSNLTLVVGPAPSPDGLPTTTTLPPPHLHEFR